MDSRRIIKKILDNITFNLPSMEDKDTYYAEHDGRIIRLSNHCMTQKELNQQLAKNPMLEYIPIISFVFEDDESTYDEIDSSMVLEYAWNLEWTPNINVDLIIKTIKKILI